MIAFYVGFSHKQWHLPEFRFALNSVVEESTGIAPAELSLQQPLGWMYCCSPEMLYLILQLIQKSLSSVTLRLLAT